LSSGIFHSSVFTLIIFKVSGTFIKLSIVLIKIFRPFTGFNYDNF